MTRQTIIILSSASLLASLGQVLFRIGAKDRLTILEFINPYIISGLVFYAIGTVAWIFALSKEEMVNVYAFTALTFVLVYVSGVCILGEHINMTKSVGVVIIMTGLYLISRS